MEQTEKDKLKAVLEEFLDSGLYDVILSNPVRKDGMSKVKIRPLLLRGELIFQAEEFCGKQAFHKNLPKEEAKTYIISSMDGNFRQMELKAQAGEARLLVGKKGTVTMKVKRTAPAKMSGGPSAVLSHNRKKRYVLEEGIPVPFLVDLGVMTADGTIVRSRYDKFRQINRFLEFIEDILPRLNKEKETTIIDFGCGKSYLTFAMYYYLKDLKGYPIRVIGLDLKKDVIERCNILSRQYGFEQLQFYTGDIASYDGVDHVDMVVTLHACDTATDYALAKAVKWGADVILSVPCCQHELNGQIENGLLEPVLRYGLIKERMAALCTDAVRAQLLEHAGYRTQILEFIDMEHTPKNILIRAVKQGGKKDNVKELEELMAFLHVKPTLKRLLDEENL
ncbi:SAM-dependent methyltransferase [Clostridium sp. AM58-1XD]|uniref:class I SAM-dependent methyltransferase n=1 Tax=Clostridium sp. AM58-1XD TaxID=2292307 RepID=UPI000E4A9E15|nr:SAM-dependent methyltransferase [Clostridium sp. AM58-1XD]RGY95928.1 SAM-dependent methyltransferase [Clostridium sp. AM58-1XD]